MVNSPKVSVVMPVYNAERFLDIAIDSILSQTFSNFEFIIIDDGSTDGSLKIIKSYKDPRIRLITRPNKGLAASLNEGLAEAKGQYIARMDADDISLPKRFEKQISFLDHNLDVGLLGSNYIIVDEAGQQLDITDVFTNPDDLKVAMATCNQYGHGSVMIRTKVFENTAVYDPQIYVEDYDLFNRIAHNYKIANLKQPLYRWRRTLSSYTYTNTKKTADKSRQVRDREFERLLKNRREYRVYTSFHPPKGQSRDYRRRKSLIFSNLAYLYAGHGKRFQAILLQTLAVGLTPRWERNRRHLKYLLHKKANLTDWQYDGI